MSLREKERKEKEKTLIQWQSSKSTRKYIVQRYKAARWTIGDRFGIQGTAGRRCEGVEY